jgi:AhpD family alkylhydroperoxidase
MDHSPSTVARRPPHQETEMERFTIHDQTTAPAGSRERLGAVRAAWGFIPKLQGTLAESPLALEAYDTLFNLVVARSTLTAIEQQVVFQAINVFHGCEYCTAGHTYLSRQAGVPEGVIRALRERTAIDDRKLEALRTFAVRVAETRGHAGDAAVTTFLAAGYTRAQVLDVVAIIATKVISNYTNHLTHTPLESFMSDPALRWVAPADLARTA